MRRIFLLNKPKFSWRSVLHLLIICVLFSSGCDGDDSEPLPSGAGEFITTAGNANIWGELYLPQGDGPFPVVVMVPGSGNEIDSDEEIASFTSVFHSVGMAVYVYHKRGTGNSTGTYPVETEGATEFLESRADDVISIIQLLSTHTDIDHSGIGLMGSSQGAWVNSIAFQERNDLDFLIMSVGGVASVGISNYYDRLMDNPAMTIEEAVAELSNFDGVLGIDPLPIIETMSLPVAWIYGGKDVSHPTYYDVPVLEGLNKSNFTIFLYENSTHEMLEENTGEMHPDLIPSMSRWIEEHFN